MFDRDFSGTINYQEFTQLWKYVTDWQNTFRQFDQDGSGSIDRHELKNALLTFGKTLVTMIFIFFNAVISRIHLAFMIAFLYLFLWLL